MLCLRMRCEDAKLAGSCEIIVGLLLHAYIQWEMLKPWRWDEWPLIEGETSRDVKLWLVLVKIGELKRIGVEIDLRTQ